MKEKTIQKAKKETKKKENSYFIALLKKRDLLFASWKIDNPKWSDRIKTAESDPSIKQCLFIDIISVENEEYKKITSIPVHGLENNWHIFLQKEYSGKRIILELTYRDKKGKLYNILGSSEIEIPLYGEDLEAGQLDEEKILLELSGIDTKAGVESGNTSW